MWYGKQASPASSTSTIDQQEIIFDDSQLLQQQQQQQPQQQQLRLQQQKPHPQQHQPQPQKSSCKCKPERTPKRPKRPKLFNLPQQQMGPWKSLQHHFLRHSDVKYKSEKRMTMAKLGDEVLQRRNGWKVHHLVGQLTDLIQNEQQNRTKLNNLLEIFIKNGAERIYDLANNCHKLPEQYATLLQSQRSYGTNQFRPDLIVTKLDDLLKGDLQRSNLFDNQLRDCRDLIVRITNEHRDRVARITTKFNKRIQL